MSPRYAEEIKTAEGGAGLDALLRFRAADLVGILNGIDESVWNPRTDPALAAPFDADDLSGKAVVQARAPAGDGPRRAARRAAASGSFRA